MSTHLRVGEVVCQAGRTRVSDNTTTDLSLVTCTGCRKRLKAERGEWFRRAAGVSDLLPLARQLASAEWLGGDIVRQTERARIEAEDAMSAARSTAASTRQLVERLGIVLSPVVPATPPAPAPTTPVGIRVRDTHANPGVYTHTTTFNVT